MPSFKVTIVELDGVELEYPTEYDLEAAVASLGFIKAIDIFDENIILSDYEFDAIFDEQGNILLGE